MKPEPISTAPQDGTEIYLVSIQNIEGKSILVSITNGYWHKEHQGFSIGQPHHDLRIGHGSATHWLPIDAFELPDELPGKESIEQYLPRARQRDRDALRHENDLYGGHAALWRADYGPRGGK